MSLHKISKYRKLIYTAEPLADAKSYCCFCVCRHYCNVQRLGEPYSCVILCSPSFLSDVSGFTQSLFELWQHNSTERLMLREMQVTGQWHIDRSHLEVHNKDRACSRAILRSHSAPSPSPENLVSCRTHFQNISIRKTCSRRSDVTTASLL